MENDSYTADNGGLRHDEGKPEFHLLPSDALRELGRVYTFGAKKYAPYNWERGMLWSRCFNSLLRHLYAYWDGQKYDEETGLHHMAHVAWNAIALLVYSLRGIGIDDRKASLLSAQQNKEAASSAGGFIQANILTGTKHFDPNFNLRNKALFTDEEMATMKEQGDKAAMSIAGTTVHPELLKKKMDESLKGLLDREMPPVKPQPLLCPLGFRIIDPAISARADIGAGAAVMINEGSAHYVVEVIQGNPTVWRVIPWDARKVPTNKAQLVHRRAILAVLEEVKESNMRCTHCPDRDAMPGKTICIDCWAPVAPPKDCSK